MLAHPFVNTHADGSDSTKTQPSNWNADHVFSAEGSQGALLYRDTGQVNGRNWLVPSTTSGQVLTSNGAGAPPSWQSPASPSSGSITKGDIFIGTANGVGGSLAAVASGQHVVSNGVGQLPSYAVAPTWYRWGAYFLRDFPAAVAKTQVGTATAIVAFIGDSWMTQNNISGPLVTQLTGTYGPGGIGWCAASDTAFLPTGVTRTVLGTWTHTGGVPSSPGVSMSDLNGSDIATPGTIQFVAVGTDFTIHYMKKSGGGSFTWQVDGGGATTINTSNATPLFSTVAISGLSNASHTILLTVTVAGTSGVQIMGADIKVTTVSGARFHNLGYTGTTTTDWNTLTSSTPWQAGLTALAPNLVCILLGVNDQTNSFNPNVLYTTNLTTMIANVRTALPNADICLVSPGDTGVASPTFTMDKYALAMQNLALAQSTAFIDSYHILGPWAAANTRGLYTNTTHVNATGGQNLADYIFRVISEGTPVHNGDAIDPVTGATKFITATGVTIAMGLVSMATLTVSANVNLATGSFLSFLNRFSMNAGGSTGRLVLTNYAGTTGIGIDVSVDSQIDVKSRDFSVFANIRALTFEVTSGGSTTISTGVGSVKMSTANPATNTAWIPYRYNGTTYFVPAFTTNAP